MNTVIFLTVMAIVAGLLTIGMLWLDTKFSRLSRGRTYDMDSADIIKALCNGKYGDESRGDK
jgi:hypothetical protein